MFSAENPLNRDKISDLIVDEWNSINKKFPDISHRRAIRVPNDPTASVPQDGQPDDLPEQPPFDVMFELRGEEVNFEALIKAVDGIGDKFGLLIDKGFSIEQISLFSGFYISASIISLFFIRNKLNPHKI